MTQQRETPVHVQPADDPATPRAALGLIGGGAAVGGLGVAWAGFTSPATAVAIVLGLALLYLGVRKYGRVVRVGGRRSGPARRAGRPGAPGPGRTRTTPGRLVSAADPERGPANVDGEVDRAEAEEFLRLFHAENPEAGPVGPRIAAVLREIDATGTYWHTPEELAFGARVAWRNNARCIGRLYWRSLQVRDLRTVSERRRRRQALLRAPAHGVQRREDPADDQRVRPGDAVPAVHPGSGTSSSSGTPGTSSRTGVSSGTPATSRFTQRADPARVAAARAARRLRRAPAGRGDRRGGAADVPRSRHDAVHEVPLEHPELAWFADLGLRWHAVPVISNNRLVIGGVSYPAAPFNGWYMGTEIGARNLGDSDRYDLVPEVAERMGLDTSDEATLWRDRALVEINRAVLHSFRANGVTITDHHTESRRFLTHLEREERAGRRCPADWSWIVPPMSGLADPGLPPLLRHRGPTAELLRRRRGRPPGAPRRAARLPLSQLRRPPAQKPSSFPRLRRRRRTSWRPGCWARRRWTSARRADGGTGELVVHQGGPAPQVRPEHLGPVDAHQVRRESKPITRFCSILVDLPRGFVATTSPLPWTIRLPVPANMM